MATMLIVEDMEPTRRSIVFVLRKASHHVDEASDGQTALTMLSEAARTGHPYDVVITDIQMGAVSGMEVLRAAKACDPLTEVIVLTGFGTIETAVESLRAGAHDYLHKPCEPEDLLACVTNAVQQRTTDQRKEEAIQTLQQLVERIDEPPPTSSPLPPTDPAAPSIQDITRIGRLCIDHQRHRVSFDGQDVHLTPTEYTLLCSLAQQRGRVISYHDIVRHTHRTTVDKTEAQTLLKPHIHKLRRKIHSDYFIGVRGIGYMLDTPENEPPAP